MFRSTVICTGPTDSEAVEAVADMLSEFSKRPWQQNVSCEWKDAVLRLTAESDVDSDGLALLDEFCDAVVAYIRCESDLHFEIESVESI